MSNTWELLLHDRVIPFETTEDLLLSNPIQHYNAPIKYGKNIKGTRIRFDPAHFGEVAYAWTFAKMNKDEWCYVFCNGQYWNRFYIYELRKDFYSLDLTTGYVQEQMRHQGLQPHNPPKFYVEADKRSQSEKDQTWFRAVTTYNAFKERKSA